MRRLTLVVQAMAALASVGAADAQPSKPRARDLGISSLIGGTTGALDAITDAMGAEVRCRPAG